MNNQTITAMNYFESMIPAEELQQLHYIPTIPQFVEWIGHKWSALPALSDTSDPFTYSEMCDIIGKKREFLNSLGLSKGDRVAVLDNATIHSAEMFLAITSAGYTAIMLPLQMQSQAIAACCRKYGVKVLAIGNAYTQVIQDA